MSLRCSVFLPLVLLMALPSVGYAQAPAPAATPQPDPDALGRQEAVRILAESRKIVSPNGVDVLTSIPVNGTTQWISVRGRDKRNPILLVLHGGPGSPEMPVDYTFQTPWEDFFTVVQWDQRGAGKTFADPANDAKKLAPTMTIAQMTDDAETVARTVMQQYGKRKIILLGHSWGTVLGVALAQRHPEWFYAYVGVGQMVNGMKNEQIGWQFALDQARLHHDADAEKELQALAPYPGTPASLTFARIGTQRKWLMQYGGLTFGRTNYNYNGDAELLSPDYTLHEVDSVDAGGLFSITALLSQVMALNYEPVTDLRCPVVLFVGRHDYAVSHELTAAWFNRLNAPAKRLVWFEDSAHMMMQEEPGRFLYHLITDVRPFAAAAGDVAPDDSVMTGK